MGLGEDVWRENHIPILVQGVAGVLACWRVV